MKTILLIISLFLGIPLAFNDQSETLYVDNDLEAVLWAESPMLYNPTNIDVDHKGRVWVTEAVEYRNFKNKAEDRFDFKKEGDRVVILEDTNQDGKADKSTVFVQDQDLQAPLGIAVICNQVIVSCAPHVIIYTDTDGDDKADEKEIFLTGFGGFDHDHSLHSFVAGPDGKWYFNTGNAGPHVVTDKAGWTLRSGSVYNGGTPYNRSNSGSRVSDDGKIWVGGLALRVNPDGTGLKVMAHNFRNSYEVAIDSYGNMWQNDNDDQVIACRTSFLMEGANAGYFSQDGERTWQADRRPDQDLFTAHWHQDDPGVMPFGDKTGAGSPTGVMVYEGMALGKERNGMLLSCEAGRNNIFGYKNTPKGSGFEMKRSIFAGSLPTDDENYIWNEKEENTAKWFRPSDAAAGTDGAIFIADWYDPVVGGHAMKDQKAYGRIYRVQPRSKKLTSPKINLNSKEGLLLAFTSPAINVRNAGFKGLLKLGTGIIPDVKNLLYNENPYVQARALWLLAELDVKLVYKYLQDEDLGVVAFRALKDKIPLNSLYEMVREGSNQQILREVAIACEPLKWQDCKDIALSLSHNLENDNPYFSTAFGIGFKNKKEELWKEFMKRVGYNELDPILEVLLFELHPDASVDILKERVLSTELSASAKNKSLTGLAFINTVEAVEAMISLTNVEDKTVADKAKWWISFRQYNTWESLYNWEGELGKTLDEDSKQMLVLRDQLLEQSISEDNMESTLSSMAMNPFGANLLVTLASASKLNWNQKTIIANYIFNNSDRGVRTLAGDYFQRPGGSRLSLDLALNMVGNKRKGELLFEANCRSCHQVKGKGGEIGPDLSSIGQKFDKSSLLDAIINPSADITFGYEPYLITATNDRSYYGFIISEGKTLSIKDLSGTIHKVKNKELIEKKLMTNSIMPDPTAMQLSEEDLASICSYLLTFNQ